ncbi:MAG: efflux RND transporter permease subunit, partial [Muribaculaceae bacterium]|nr:efflux RND transporter permease subunit [Muribaculaceae bacterium]
EETHSWNFGKDPTQYALLALIAAIIFFISAILFNSLRQPFAIIAVIPVSFIGVFLTFYIFDLRFDQGGFASFILLCGITVNAAIYIINEYNSLRASHPHVKQENLYRRAFRAKITAVLLTVLSTVLGFIPFVIGSTREGFWFPLAAGTMGGLLMSMLAIFILLPLCIIRTDKPSSRKCHAI